ncbi:MAG TPA: hypothetical protein VG711_00125, partial [Phycisphaerales bacterium]|nr:hypothetical protein [Phycisphaerales bacterium]
MSEHDSPAHSTSDKSDDREHEVQGVTRLQSEGESDPYDEVVSRLLEQEHVDSPAIADAVSEQEPADAADALEALEEEDAADVLEHMEIQAAADALAEMDTSLATGVVEDLVDEGSAQYAAKLVQRMAPDDAADLLQALSRPHREKLLADLPSPQAAGLRRLIGYDPESAGGLMTTDYIALRDSMSVAQAIEVIRARPIPEGMQFLLVVTAAGELV